MAKKPVKKKPKARLPLEAALKIRSHPVSSRKGEKGYDRKRLKKENRKTIEERTIDECES
jgi:hypothetical protein